VIGADPGDQLIPEREEGPVHNLNGDNGLPAPGPMGPILGEQVREGAVRAVLPQALSGYTLPPPPSGEALTEAIRASLRMLTAGPDHVTFPLYAGVWRAPLGAAPFSLFLHGPTGTAKTTIAALAQQHFGAGMHYRNLPGSWTSTANSLAATAFLVKDAVL